MTTPSPSAPNESFFEAIKRGVKKRAPLIASLKHTPLNDDNIFEFIKLVNELNSPLSAELISHVWTNLNPDSRLRVLREWLDGKDKERQASGFHTLAAMLLACDAASSMTLLDRVIKLSASSVACRRKAVVATKTEWVGTTPEQARFRRLDLGLLSLPRLVLLDWLFEATVADTNPADDEQRKASLNEESRKRSALVAEWMESLQQAGLPEAVAEAVVRCQSRLLPGFAAKPKPAAEAQNAPANVEHSAPVPVAPSSLVSKASPTASTQEPDDMFREVFGIIRKLFRKESELRDKEIRSLGSQLEAAKAALARAERDITAFRDAHKKNVQQLSELEEAHHALKAAKEKADTELSVAIATLSTVKDELETERRITMDAREESHQAVTRETQRERDRLLGQLSQRISNVVESYREIRSREPLPAGVPAMIGGMMDELLSRLEAAGVRMKRE